METTTAHPKLSAMIDGIHGPKQDASRTSPDLAHTIAPFAIAIAVVELYRASYGDTPPAQMIWKKQKVGSVNKRGTCACDEANGNRNYEIIKSVI